MLVWLALFRFRLRASARTRSTITRAAQIRFALLSAQHDNRARGFDSRTLYVSSDCLIASIAITSLSDGDNNNEGAKRALT